MNAYSIYIILTALSAATYLLWYVIHDYKFIHHPLIAVRLLSGWNKIINGTTMYVFVLIALIYNFANEDIKQEFTNCIADLTGFALKICVFTNAITLIVDTIYNFSEAKKSKEACHERKRG